MARLGTQFSPTVRDRSHEQLGAQRANFEALLARRWVANFQNFQANLAQLNQEIQRLRGGNAADIMAQWNIEAARADMQRFFDQFIDILQTQPQWLHSVAQAISPAVNIPAFHVSPAQEFAWAWVQPIIQQLREGNGPFNAVDNAVEHAGNTDLYVLFSLYARARAVVLNAQNPNQAQANEARLRALETQRANLSRTNDELVGAYNQFDRQETNASMRTWASRAGSAVAGAAMAVVVGWVKLPSISAALPTSAQPSVSVTVNVGTTISLWHTVSTDWSGTLSIKPQNTSDSTEVNKSFFQFKDVRVQPNWEISWNMIYVAKWSDERKIISVKAWENALPDGKKITLERTPDGRLQFTFEWVVTKY
jgi:hypothetical protein